MPPYLTAPVNAWTGSTLISNGLLWTGVFWTDTKWNIAFLVFISCLFLVLTILLLTAKSFILTYFQAHQGKRMTDDRRSASLHTAAGKVMLGMSTWSNKFFMYQAKSTLVPSGYFARFKFLNLVQSQIVISLYLFHTPGWVLYCFHFDWFQIKSSCLQPKEKGHSWSAFWLWY